MTGSALRRAAAVAVVMGLALAMLHFYRAGRVGAPPRSLGLPAFYAKYVSVGGLPVLGSSRVPDRALRVAADIIRHLCRQRHDVLRQLASVRVRVAVIAKSEKTTDIPEYAGLPTEYWDWRARGLGATVERRVCSAAEENLLGYPGDRWPEVNVLVHEFAHTIHTLALSYLQPDFDQRLRDLYRDARKRGLFDSTYAGTNSSEYWAEGVTSWFDSNRQAIPTDGISNSVNTRSELEEYDPALADLIRSVFRDVDPLPPPARRLEAARLRDPALPLDSIGSRPVSATP